MEISEIIKEAEAFKCCPYCGNPDLDSEHFCNKCGERIVEPDDAYWFAEYLKKKYGGGKNDGTNKVFH